METAKLIETVNMAQCGDSNALQTLYLEMYRSVYFLALRFVKNPEDAEDITQEVYITVQQKIPELRQPIAFYGWANQITVNKCNRFLSKYKGISWLDDEEEFLSISDDDPANLPDKALDDEATRKIILEVIDKLPDGQRACVLLYYYAQNTIAQIADMLETNENTVKSRLALARAKIRAALEEKEKKEGIKLWGIPLALTPILRQDHDTFIMPQGAEARIIDFISRATIENMGVIDSPVTDTNDSSRTEQPTSPKTAQNLQKPVFGTTGISGMAEIAGKTVANTLMKKAIIALLAVAGAAVIITAGIIVIPMLTNTSDALQSPGAADTSTSSTPLSVADTASSGTTPGDSGGILEETPSSVGAPAETPSRPLESPPSNANTPPALETVERLGVLGGANGNMHNGGYYTVSDGWVYGGTDNIWAAPLSTDLWEIREIIAYNYGTYINVIDGWVYFLQDGLIKRVRTDGADEKIYTEARECSVLYVTESWLYFADDAYEQTLRRMSHDGGEIYDVAKGMGSFNFTDEWIIYANMSQCAMRTRADGSGSEQITGELSNIYGSLIVYDDWLYYVHSYGMGSCEIGRVRFDGSGQTILTQGDFAYPQNFNVMDGYFYFAPYESNEGPSGGGPIYRIAVDGSSGAEFLADVVSGSIFALDGYILYEDLSMYPYVMTPDGSQVWQYYGWLDFIADNG